MGEPDYSLNPWGYQADDSDSFIRQGIRYDVSDFYANGYTNPMVRLVGVENVAHACSNVYASLAWDYISRFARGEDGSVVELVSGSGNPAPDTPSDPEPFLHLCGAKGRQPVENRQGASGQRLPLERAV